MQAYAHIANAQKLLADNLAAEALKSSAEADKELRRSQEAGASFLKTLPKDKAAGLEAFQRHVKNTVGASIWA